VVRQIGERKLYVGAGIAIDQHFSIEDEKLEIDTSSENFYITNHFAYSTLKKFDPERYSTNGLNLNLLVDTRDVIANPYSGYYAVFAIRYNPEFLGSTQESTMLFYDFRYYLGLSKVKKRQLLAFWTWGTFVAGGEVPYLALPSIGWDTYNRSGRGYIQGRYRGFDMIYTEAEYRFPISRNGLWGGVAFLSCTFASSTDQEIFKKAAPAMGIGVRLKMDKRTRVNLTADIAVGLDKSSGVYFGMQEAF
jgi:outer membrane protein assembly factor BamA